jgi:hypothetical protein
MAGSLYAYDCVLKAPRDPADTAPEGEDCQDVHMRRSIALPVVLLSLLGAGCGSDEAATPVVCLEGPAKIETALVTAPDPVRIDGTVPISDCMIRDQPNGELVNFGSDAVAVATRLGTRAGGSGTEAIRAAIQAGYLGGAMEKGSEGSDGIHTTLVDRVKSAATYRMDDSPGAKVHYEAGAEAGREFG